MLRRRLHQSAHLDELPNALEEVGPGVALGVGHESVEAAVMKPVHELDEVIVDRAGPRLDQQPASADPQRDQPQLLGGEGFDPLGSDLTALGDPDRNALLVECPVRERDEAFELRDLDVVVGADVRRGDDHVDPVVSGLAGHRDGVRDVARAVVEPGQEMAMEVDHEESATR